MSFSELVTVLKDVPVVAIVTRRRDGRALATPIWSMVIDGVPYIRSAYGETSWWYRHLLAGREAAFVRGDGAIAERDRAVALELPREPVAVAAVPVEDPIQSAIDAEIERKYAGSLRSSIDAMLSPEAVACTLRIGPLRIDPPRTDPARGTAE